MPAYTCNVTQAKVYSKIGSGEIGALKRGEFFFSDGREFEDTNGVIYLYGNCTLGGQSRNGYVKKGQLTIQPSTPPPPDPEPEPNPASGDVELVLDDAGVLKKVSQGGVTLWQR